MDSPTGPSADASGLDSLASGANVAAWPADQIELWKVCVFEKAAEVIRDYGGSTRRAIIRRVLGKVPYSGQEDAVAFAVKDEVKKYVSNPK